MGFKLAAPAFGRASGAGRAPAISDDGAAIAFFGDLTDPTLCGQCAPKMTAGDGIFLSVVGATGARTIVRVTGGMVEDMAAPAGNGDGICDPGEPCVRAAELGYDDAGNPVYFKTYDFDARLGVVHQALGTGAGEGPTPAFTWSIQAHYGADANGDHLIDYTIYGGSGAGPASHCRLQRRDDGRPGTARFVLMGLRRRRLRLGRGCLAHLLDAERPRRGAHGRRRLGRLDDPDEDDHDPRHRHRLPR